MFSPGVWHGGTRLVIVATTSIALASRLVAGSNSVISPVCSGTATAGHLLRVAVMPPPADTSISLLRPQPETVARTAVQIGRASCGERVCQKVLFPVVAVCLKKKQQQQTIPITI